MARINNKQLNKLPVYTESNLFVGRVVGFEIIIETSKIAYYYVRPGMFPFNLNKKNLFITPKQVVEITNQRMVVEDTGVLDENPLKNKTKSSEAITLSLSERERS